MIKLNTIYLIELKDDNDPNIWLVWLKKITKDRWLTAHTLSPYHQNAPEPFFETSTGHFDKDDIIIIKKIKENPTEKDWKEASNFYIKIPYEII